MEALLLWAVQQKAADIKAAVARAVTSGALVATPKKPDPLGWDLHEFVEVASELALIGDQTTKQARLARNFRNLIHPGRSLKRGETCDRGTALAASAAVELVSRDLQKKFP